MSLEHVEQTVFSISKSIPRFDSQLQVFLSKRELVMFDLSCFLSPFYDLG